MNQLRAANFIQALNYFIVGIYSVILPLAMEERGINIVTIGFIFASMPMIFQLGRLAFAVLSDFLGRKVFFVTNGFLGVISSLVYYAANTPLEFLFGKVIEGTQSSSLWAVNRAFLMEIGESKRRVLVNMRTVTYIAWAAGSLLTGLLVASITYGGTLILCALIGVFLVFASLSLVDRRRKEFRMAKALKFLDFRRKNKIFKIFLGLFFLMGLSFGFLKGFVFPLFLSSKGFGPTLIGMFIGLQTLLAGLSSHLFAERFELGRGFLLSGILHTAVLSGLGFSTFLSAGILVVAYGIVEGLVGIGQEGIYLKITEKQSYATDVGLLTLGFQGGITVSLAVSGFVISTYDFSAVFFLSASIFVLFYAASYRLLKE